MILAELSLRVPGVSRGYLFGSPKNPRAVTVRLGFVTLIWVSAEGRNAIMEATRGVIHDPQWWAANHPTIRTARAQAERKAWADASTKTTRYKASLRDELADLNNRVHTLDRDNYELRNALRVVRALDTPPPVG